MTLHGAMKLGKRSPRHDERSLRLAKYAGALPPAPDAVDWFARVPTWPMYRNDEIGDCTIASAAHMIQAWTADASGQEADLADADVISAYSAVTGYTPSDPTTDQGAVELDVLRYWRTTGIGGHRIGAFAIVDLHRDDLYRAGLWIFGGLYLGLSLPLTAQDQEVWDVVPGGTGRDSEPGSWGGHAVPVGSYDTDGEKVITWGTSKRMTTAFRRTYCEEAYAILARDFLTGGRSASGFDLVTLNADLAAVAT